MHESKKENKMCTFSIANNLMSHSINCLATKEDEIPMKQNSAYVVPPSRLKIKVKKNEAYSSCTVQH